MAQADFNIQCSRTCALYAASVSPPATEKQLDRPLQPPRMPPYRVTYTVAHPDENIRQRAPTVSPYPNPPRALATVRVCNVPLQGATHVQFYLLAVDNNTTVDEVKEKVAQTVRERGGEHVTIQRGQFKLLLKPWDHETNCLSEHAYHAPFDAKFSEIPRSSPTGPAYDFTFKWADGRWVWR